MESAQSYIDSVTEDIARTRSRATNYVIANVVLRCVGMIVFLTGAIRGVAETTLSPSNGLAFLNIPGRLAATIMVVA
jgi:hypothetical protein